MSLPFETLKTTKTGSLTGAKMRSVQIVAMVTQDELRRLNPLKKSDISRAFSEAVAGIPMRRAIILLNGGFKPPCLPVDCYLPARWDTANQNANPNTCVDSKGNDCTRE